MGVTSLIFIVALLTYATITHGLSCYNCKGSSNEPNNCMGQAANYHTITCSDGAGNESEQYNCIKIHGLANGTEVVHRKCIRSFLPQGCKASETDVDRLVVPITTCVCNSDGCNGGDFDLPTEVDAQKGLKIWSFYDNLPLWAKALILIGLSLLLTIVYCCFCKSKSGSGGRRRGVVVGGGGGFFDYDSD